MKLGVKDRIVLLRILPAEGDFRTMRTIMELRTKLLFTDEEVKAFDITIDDNIYRWDTAKATEIEVEFGDVATEVVVTVGLLVYIISGIREKFGSTDTSQLSELHW